MTDAVRGRSFAVRRSLGPAGAGWSAASVLVASLAAVPLAALLVLAAQPTGELWAHLLANVLPEAARTTLLLGLGVGFTTAVAGVGVAWLVAMCRFPGARVLEWALLLPLAIPTYIAAYAYVELLDTLGPVQSGLRALLGWRPGTHVLPPIRSLGGAVFVLSAVLYPYVYLSARASFLLQSAAALDVSRALGAGPWRAFLRVALPLARPAIVAGVALALMEMLNDIGAVQHLGVTTLTLSVYTTWLHRGSLAGAAQIACAMLFLVVALLAAAVITGAGAKHGSKHVDAAATSTTAATTEATGVIVRFSVRRGRSTIMASAMRRMSSS
jgi:iron(III) transport system permease protein